MALRQDIELQDKYRAAAGLLSASESLRAQLTDVRAAIDAVKPIIKFDVAIDLWQADKIKSLSDNLEREAAMIKQAAANKADLIILRDSMVNNDYKTEIQTEIDSIP